MANRPVRRPTNVTGTGKGINRRGSGLGTGPVGNPGGYAGRGGSGGSGDSGGPVGGGGRSSGGRASGGKGGIIKIIIIALVVLLGGGTGLSGLLGGGNSSSSSSGGIGDLFSGGSVNPFVNMASAAVSSGWSGSSNSGKINTSVDPAAREKYTQILGNGSDTVTIMAYVCGADLESRSGMATADLQEMAKATLGSKINLIVCTGGASKWKNNVISNKYIQIYKIVNGKLQRLENNFGSGAMTDPATLASFIKYCAKNYPANRNELIMWDHGGGAISGFGYDENNLRSGSMNLKGIASALKSGGVKFDFIGFDACLMGTVENALTLAPYADYLIASEEVEPGIGWYYTNWLTKFANNTSMPTVEVGKLIADDFVSACGSQCSGQKTTLSVTDLAELERTVPDTLTGFAESTLELLQNEEYKTVADARGGAREFGTSSKVDHVDLVSLSTKIGTSESKQLAETIRSAVKYNRTSSDMTDAYGLSIYFPYRKLSNVNTAVNAYESIGMDDDYTKCIQKFAGLQVGGQAVSGGASSPLGSLLGGFTGGSSSAGSADAVTQILSSLLSGGTGNVEGLTGANSFFLGRAVDVEADAEYLTENRFDASALRWKQAGGQKVMALPEKQWALVHELEKNVFVDDGEGYIDLGLDNTFDFTEEGALIGEPGNSWLAIDEQVVAYYYTDTLQNGDSYIITGRIPALLNGERVNLIVVFDSDHTYGTVAGAEPVYDEGVEVAAKSLTKLQNGDRIDFICDYYNYDGSYEDSYLLGETYTVSGTPVVNDVDISDYTVSTAYRFTDIYRQNYWTPVVED